MNKICLLLATLLNISSVFCADPEMDNGVMVLNDDNFDDAIAANPLILVEFYAPWCGHCKKLAPEYEKAAVELTKNDPPIVLAKVDATGDNAKKLKDRFEIKGFPTLKWFKNGEKSDYKGGRTKDTIISWTTKKSGPPSAAIECAALKEKVESDVKFLIAYFGSVESKLHTDVHLPFADSEDSIIFVHAPAECAADHGLSAEGDKIVLFRKFDELVNLYDGEADKESVQKWVKSLKVPTFFELSQEIMPAVFGEKQNVTVLFINKDDIEAEYVKEFEKAATTNKGKSLFAWANINEGIGKKLGDHFGVKNDSVPAVRFLVVDGMLKYVYEGSVADLTVATATKFVDDVLAGALKPHLKSAEPVDNTGKALTEIVGTNWKEIVHDETKDVLVKYYAPWCGHCKKLAPVWDQLAEHYKDNENLVIAKFDATANEAEGVKVRGYPTLIFYPKDNKAGVDYKDKRELDDFKNWLDKNSPVLKEAKGGDGHQEEL